MAPGSRLNTSRQAAPLRLAYSAPEPDSATIEELRRLTLPATKALPFVKLRINDQPLWRPECYWNVQSTGKRGLDVALGRAYARRAITAMKTDHNPALIGLIIQDIISDGIKRGGKNGRGRLSHLALGFLDEISRTIAADADAQ